MVWKAQLQSVTSQSGPADYIDLNIRFFNDATGKDYTRSYTFDYNTAQSVTEIRDRVKIELHKLNLYETVKSNLSSLIGVTVEE